VQDAVLPDESRLPAGAPGSSALVPGFSAFRERRGCACWARRCHWGALALVWPTCRRLGGATAPTSPPMVGMPRSPARTSWAWALPAASFPLFLTLALCCASAPAALGGARHQRVCSSPSPPPMARSATSHECAPRRRPLVFSPLRERFHVHARAFSAPLRGRGRPRPRGHRGGCGLWAMGCSRAAGPGGLRRTCMGVDPDPRKVAGRGRARAAAQRAARGGP
jgi:hypothetical protein